MLAVTTGGKASVVGGEKIQTQPTPVPTERAVTLITNDGNNQQLLKVNNGEDSERYGPWMLVQRKNRNRNSRQANNNNNVVGEKGKKIDLKGNVKSVNIVEKKVEKSGSSSKTVEVVTPKLMEVETHKNLLMRKKLFQANYLLTLRLIKSETLLGEKIHKWDREKRQ